MSEIRQNIFLSILIHTALIAAVFSTLGSSNLTRKDFTSVMLLDELHEIEKAGGNRASPAKPNINYKRSKENKTWGEPFKKTSYDIEKNTPKLSSPIINETMPLTDHLSDKNRTDSNTAQRASITIAKETPGSGEAIYPNPIRNDASPGEGSKASVKFAVKAGVYHETGNTNYIKAIRSAIKNNLIYPALARRNRIEGTVLTEFSIGADGLPINIRVIKTSGFNVLDSAALQTITKASPFPVLKGNIEIPITFVLKK